MAHKHGLNCIDRHGYKICGQTASPEDEWEDERGERYVIGEQDFPGLGRRVVVARASSPNHELLEPEWLPRQRQLDIANAASRRRGLERERATKAQAAAVLGAKRGLHGFTAGMPAVKARKVEETLDKLVSISRAFAKRREHIEDLVSKGWRIELSKYAATLGERRLTEPGGGGYFSEKDITKIGMDYAEFLLGQR